MTDKPESKDEIVVFPDWERKLADRFPNGVPTPPTPFMEMMSKAKQTKDRK